MAETLLNKATFSTRLGLSAVKFRSIEGFFQSFQILNLSKHIYWKWKYDAVLRKCVAVCSQKRKLIVNAHALFGGSISVKFRFSKENATNDGTGLPAYSDNEKVLL